MKQLAYFTAIAVLLIIAACQNPTNRLPVDPFAASRSFSFPLIDSNAMKLYFEWKFRQCRDVLTAKGALTAPETYLLARCYQELRQLDTAITNYRRIDLNELKEHPYAAFLIENFAYNYSQSLLASSTRYPDSMETIGQLVSTMDKRSLYYDDTLSVYFYYQWNKGNYDLIKNYDFDGEKTTLYKKLARFMTGEDGLLTEALTNYSRSPHKLIYQQILKRIGSVTLSDTNALDALVKIAGDLKDFPKAQAAMERLAALRKDPNRNQIARYLLSIKQNDAKNAVKQMEAFIKSGLASTNTIDFYVGRYIRQKDYKKAMSLLQQWIAKYPKELADDYAECIVRLKQLPVAAKFLIDTAETIPERSAEKLARFLIQTDPNGAIPVLERFLKIRTEYTIALNLGLIYYEQSRYGDAYPFLLKVTLEYPFTYEWLVARRYEKELRSQYSGVFQAQSGDLIDTFPKLDTKQRLYLTLGIRESAPEVFNARLNTGEFAAEYAQQTNSATNYFNIASNLPSDDQIIPAAFYAFGKDMIPYLERTLSAQVKNLPVKDRETERYRLTYRLKDLYKKIGYDGKICDRTDYYLRGQLKERRFYPLLPVSVQREIFPLIEFPTLIELMDNTNTALWVTAAYHQESRFCKDVISWVGAVGMAQVMPATFDGLKKNLKRPEMSNYDFGDNITAGASLFKYLFKRHGNFAYALSAYNAGEGAMSKWRKQFNHKTELWIECIPYDETRDYVKVIWAFRYFYDRLYGLEEFTYPEF